ncbi:hypothetical protein D0Z00_004021 [Geotrichum galactomycetum]|uniref:Uncharacterized protein n=1 Tax=Geotrichum galactomycetum TaxID=27317 RepID=A0ACB6UZL3_9ASCO|nr:hypothetical protein D0Z00_004021 [Geotrichum candidum]
MTSAAQDPIPDIPATTAISSIDSEGLSLYVKTWEKTRPGIILRTGIKLLAKYLPKLRSKTGLNLDYLTTDLERLKYLKATPKRVEATGPQMAAMLDRGEKLVEADFVAEFIDNPVACFHGTGDLINAFRGTAQFFDLLKVSDKKLYSYPDYYHDLFHETRERVDQVLNDTYEWLDARTSNGDVEVTHKETAKVIEVADKVQHEGPATVELQAAVVTAY